MKAFLVFIAVVVIAKISQPHAITGDGNISQNEIAPSFPGLSDCDNPVLDCATMKSLCTSPGVWYQDQDVCYCKCPEWVSQTCPKHQYFDKRICRCTCFEPLECRKCSNNQIWNEKTCSCGCPRAYKCPKNQHFSHLSCQCECNQQPRDCCTGSRPAKIWDQKLCDCTCAQVKCCATWAGYFWHPHLCKCVSKFRTIDYAHEVEKIQNGIDDCEGVCPVLSSTTPQTSTTSTKIFTTSIPTTTPFLLPTTPPTSTLKTTTKEPTTSITDHTTTAETITTTDGYIFLIEQLYRLRSALTDQQSKIDEMNSSLGPAQCFGSLKNESISMIQMVDYYILNVRAFDVLTIDDIFATLQSSYQNLNAAIDACTFANASTTTSMDTPTSTLPRIPTTPPTTTLTDTTTTTVATTIQDPPVIIECPLCTDLAAMTDALRNTLQPNSACTNCVAGTKQQFSSVYYYLYCCMPVE